MASTESAEITLQKLYELNNLYQSKSKKEGLLSHNTSIPMYVIFYFVNNSQPIENLVEIEYVPSKIVLDRNDPNYSYFSTIFEKFKIDDPSFVESSEISTEDIIKKLKPIFPILPEDEEDESAEKLSKKKLKQQSRISIATLKQRVQRPEVVEVHDANSKEPVLLIHLKSYRNTPTVPKHWSYKRKYLQGKRGFVKPPFELPDYIK
ncbi:hypothetical protein MXB_3809, partial [Myxobolus squamalis]